MQPVALSYSMPETLEPDIARVRAYWEDLKRGEATMPFSDDIDLSRLGVLEDWALLVSVFEYPERFRFEAVGTAIATRYNTPINGAFSDELDQRSPLEQFTNQASATIAHRVPTYFHSEATGGTGYSRILLPTWGDGRIAMLLGAVTGAAGEPR